MWENKMVFYVCRFKHLPYSKLIMESGTKTLKLHFWKTIISHGNGTYIHTSTKFQFLA
jgi:hypothetical protein